MALPSMRSRSADTGSPARSPVRALPVGTPRQIAPAQLLSASASPQTSPSRTSSSHGSQNTGSVHQNLDLRRASPPTEEMGASSAMAGPLSALATASTPSVVHRALPESSETLHGDMVVTPLDQTAPLPENMNEAWPAPSTAGSSLSLDTRELASLNRPLPAIQQEPSPTSRQSHRTSPGAEWPSSHPDAALLLVRTPASHPGHIPSNVSSSVCHTLCLSRNETDLQLAPQSLRGTTPSAGIHHSERDLPALPPPSNASASPVQDRKMAFESFQPQRRPHGAPRPRSDVQSLYRRSSNGSSVSKRSVSTLAEQASVASGTPASTTGLEGVLLPGENPGKLVRSSTIELYDFNEPRPGSVGEATGRVERGWTPARAHLFDHLLVVSHRLPENPDLHHLVFTLADITRVRSGRIVNCLPPANERRRYPLEVHMTEPGELFISFSSARERLEFNMEIECVDSRPPPPGPKVPCESGTDKVQGMYTPSCDRRLSTRRRPCGRLSTPVCPGGGTDPAAAQRRQSTLALLYWRATLCWWATWQRRGSCERTALRSATGGARYAAPRIASGYRSRLTGPSWMVSGRLGAEVPAVALNVP